MNMKWNLGLWSVPIFVSQCIASVVVAWHGGHQNAAYALTGLTGIIAFLSLCWVLRRGVGWSFLLVYTCALIGTWFLNTYMEPTGLRSAAVLSVLLAPAGLGVYPTITVIWRRDRNTLYGPVTRTRPA